ncbi:MAG TPA: 30S ribosomal protein S20 [Blastocatellia bacterium]|nr:30S ribosomal protein S20 [Blastocatellia bacterium]
MANHKSAEKRARQSEKRKVLNKRNRSRLRSAIKDLRGAIDEGKADNAKALLGATVSLIDKSVQKGIVHRNAAARHKSRLTAKVNTLSS